MTTPRRDTEEAPSTEPAHQPPRAIPAVMGWLPVNSALWQRARQGNPEAKRTLLGRLDGQTAWAASRSTPCQTGEEPVPVWELMKAGIVVRLVVQTA